MSAVRAAARPVTGRGSRRVRRCDVVVVGGGAAGLTAALVLARARHSVVVVDDGTPRNRTVDEFHGFPTRDSSSPARFRSDAARELRSYGVDVVRTGVTRATGAQQTVALDLADGTTVVASSLVLATGVRDDLPAIEGLAARWGRSAFNCPFCDGWEHRDRPVVVIDAAPGTDHLVGLLRSWTTDITVVAASDVVALVGDGTTLDHVRLRDGRVVDAEAVFVKAPVQPRSSIAVELGCAVDADGYIVTDDTGATTQPLVWAAGDVRRPPPMPHQVVLAAADGSTVAIAMHKAFVAGVLTGARVGVVS